MVSRKRIRSSTPGTVGGGGEVGTGTALVKWGPDFGEGSGNDDSTWKVGASASLGSPIRLSNNKTVGVDLDHNVAVEYVAQSIGVNVDLDKLAMVNTKNVGVSASLDGVAATYTSGNVGSSLTFPELGLSNTKTVGAHLSGTVLGAPFWQSVATGTSSSNTVTVNKPSNVQIGDILLAFTGAQESAGAPTAINPPIGWARIATNNISNMRAASFFRIIDGTEGSSFVFTATAAISVQRMVGEVHHINAAFSSRELDLSTASYDNTKDKSVNTEESQPQDVAFMPDGSKMFVIGAANNTVKTYTLTTPWDPSTGSYVSAQDKNVSTEETVCRSITFKPDGTKMFIIGSNGNTVKSYNLSTAWNPSTASYNASQDKDVSSEETICTDLAFKPDGTKMFVVGVANDIVRVYNLSTPWDPSTGTHVASEGKNVNSQVMSPNGLLFTSDGKKMCVVGGDEDTITSYLLSEAWNPSTGVHQSSEDKLITTEDGAPVGLFLDAGLSRLFLMGSATDTVYSYNMTTVVNTFATATLSAAALDPDPDSPSVTTTVSNTRVFALLLHDHLTLSQTHTPAANHVERTDFQSSTTGNRISSHSMDRVFSATGSTGTAEHNCTETAATNALMHRIAIAPGSLEIAL